MKNWTSVSFRIGLLVLSASAATLIACHSYHIEATIKNDTGGAISLLEIDYPSASFGADAIAMGKELHHRIQTRGSGPLKVQYTDGSGKQVQISGPNLYEDQEGRIDVDLLPNGKADFHPTLNPAH